jgi:hypothetical protein
MMGPTHKMGTWLHPSTQQRPRRGDNKDDPPDEEMTVDLDFLLGREESQRGTGSALVDNDPPPGTQEAESNGDKNTDGKGTTDRTQDSEKEWGDGVGAAN